MASYRFYCMSGKSRVDAVRVGDFADDAGARMLAGTMFEATGSDALEVWAGWRLVARLERAPLPA
ncbi:MAG TPA: hypothetical protein VN668_19215 [Stellaceae bacterium]|nr:hypothetical protein [Stellaceae bacterium]